MVHMNEACATFHFVKVYLLGSASMWHSLVIDFYFLFSVAFLLCFLPLVFVCLFRLSSMFCLDGTIFATHPIIYVSILHFIMLFC